MIPAELSGNISPDRREPIHVILGLNTRPPLHELGRLAVAAGLPEEQDVFDVVLHDAVRQVGLAEIPRRPAKTSSLMLATFCQRIGVRLSKPILRARTCRSADKAGRDAGRPYVSICRRSDHAGDAPSWHQHAQAFGPDCVQLVQKLFVGRYVAELTLMIGVLDRGP